MTSVDTSVERKSCLLCGAEFPTTEDLAFHEKRCWDCDDFGESEANEYTDSVAEWANWKLE